MSKERIATIVFACLIAFYLGTILGSERWANNYAMCMERFDELDISCKESNQNIGKVLENSLEQIRKTCNTALEESNSSLRLKRFLVGYEKLRVIAVVNENQTTLKIGNLIGELNE